MKLIRSKRRTISLEIDADTNLIVRAPIKVSGNYIEKLIQAKRMWIIKKQQQMRKIAENNLVVYQNIDRYDAYKIIKERLDLFSLITGIKYNKFKLTNPKKRWGSCNSKGNICINMRLAAAPQEVIDYVVVHELSHILEHNHSRRFWAKVAQILPAYKNPRKWLKENASLLR